MPEAKIGVIGGTGVYQIDGLAAVQELDLTTPFGKPSDKIIVGRLGGTGIAFLPRHGKGHRILPGEVPSRANIYALKSLGVEHVIAICSAGSFKEEVKPGHLLIPDQLIDRTSGRPGTFFGEGIVAHVAFADPFCAGLRKVLYESALEVGATVHPEGTMVVMEGPAFSTRAESRLHAAWGASLIGMTALPEAKLAREAEMCYAIIGCVTDYDSWHEQHEPVTVQAIMEILRRNADISKQMVKTAAARMPAKRECECASALKTAIVTSPEIVPPATKKKLGLIIERYMK